MSTADDSDRNLASVGNLCISAPRSALPLAGLAFNSKQSDENLSERSTELLAEPRDGGRLHASLKRWRLQISHVEQLLVTLLGWIEVGV